MMLPTYICIVYTVSYHAYPTPKVMCLVVYGRLALLASDRLVHQASFLHIYWGSMFLETPRMVGLCF